ncbi:het-domain protein [Fusarium subglutinans]|uniref:Het-domain protein n=1 Tax=Gibberella subglutinans TaxID=42677 RepID=A0A8H5PBU5_GIBSU|nr:het-domain protein [Fusarium subglutinans]KAF5593790.1 het-domain protein [Fusarium subglutinans]
MMNSVRQPRAQLDDIVKVKQSRPICRDLQPGDEYDELNTIGIESLRDDCGYCRILESAMNSIVDEPTTQLFVHSKEGEPISVEYFYEKDLDPEDTYASKAGFIIYSHDKSQLIPGLGILGAYPESTELGASVNFINVQMLECSTKHESCKKQLESPLPTRVVGVGSSDTDIRLVELKDVPAQYVTLSHCWGGKQPLRTVTANIDAMKKSIDVDSQPIVFQQAVQIVRALNIEYIWIDSLCIIQDSKSDWELDSFQNVRLLRKLLLDYLNSHVTKFHRPISRPTRQAVRIPKEPEEEGMIFTRAWTWQEAAMSSRTIYFTPSELIWECSEHVAPQRYIPDLETSERLGFSKLLSILRFSLNLDMGRDIDSPVRSGSDSIPSSDSPIGIPPTGFDSAMSSNSLAPSRPDSPSSISSEANMMNFVWDMWDDLVTYYSRRHLTFVTDKLPALSGVASRVLKITKSRYLAGMWEDNLGIELCWSRAYREYQDLPTISAEYVAPSWSWASIPGVVKSRVERTISIFEPSFTIIEANSNVSGLNPFGRVTAGHLLMRGQIAEAVLTCDDPQTSVFYKISGPTEKWEFSPDSILVLDDNHLLRAKQDAKASKFTAKVYCLYIGSTYSNRGDESDREHFIRAVNSPLCGVLTFSKHISKVNIFGVAILGACKSVHIFHKFSSRVINHQLDTNAPLHTQQQITNETRMSLINSVLAVLPNVPFLPPGPPANEDAKKQKSPLDRFLGTPSKEKKHATPTASENRDRS